MEINSKTIDKIIEKTSDAVGTIHNDIINPWLLNKRLQSNKKYTYIRKNGNVLYFNEGVPINIDDLTGEEQVNFQKYKNQVENINVLYQELYEKVQSTQEEINDMENRIMQSLVTNEEFFQYYTEKTQYISNKDKINILNKIIVDKLNNNEDISTNILDFINNLTASDIRKLQEIKKLLLSVSYLSLNDKKSLNSEELLVEGNVKIFLPALMGDKLLNQLELNIKWDDIIDFSTRGLFTINEMFMSMKAQKEKPLSQAIMQGLSHKSDIYVINSETKEGIIEFRNHTLSRLGNDVFSVIPAIEYNSEEYINILLKNNIFIYTNTKKILYNEEKNKMYLEIVKYINNKSQN